MAEYIERAEVLKKFEEIKNSVDITFADALYLDGVMELIDSVPSADVAPVRTELRKAVDLLHKNYEKALNSPYVHDLIAWTLYHTWKEMNGGADNG